MNIQKAVKDARIAQGDQVLKLRFANARHENVIRTPNHVEPPAARFQRDGALSAGVAHQQYCAILLEQAGDALIIVCAAIHQARDVVRMFGVSGFCSVETIERQRIEEAGNAS